MKKIFNLFFALLVSISAMAQNTTTHEYVDLGLSVLWATCNVGASSPEQYGDYFAWAETKPKTRYNWITYKWCREEHTKLTKYCIESIYGTVDNKTVLDISDDAARANWGGSWRMPTVEEINELIKNCSWKWVTVNGVQGYKVTGSTGNSIFLPTCGEQVNSTLERAGRVAYYWTSTFCKDSSSDAFEFWFHSSDGSNRANPRCDGKCIRPVMKNTSYVKKAAPGPVAVDLGLSVKWANYNLGATSPEGYGNYYAWGEVAPKRSYLSDTYKWYKNMFGTLTKYCENSSKGIVDNKTVLDPSDDAATATWGGSWRIPTRAEQDELVYECKWTMGFLNGVRGYQVTSKTNGNSIFLPAAGFKGGDGVDDLGYWGYYWSNSISSGSSTYGNIMLLNTSEVYLSDRPRTEGLSIRPVCK